MSNINFKSEYIEMSPSCAQKSTIGKVALVPVNKLSMKSIVVLKPNQANKSFSMVQQSQSKNVKESKGAPIHSIHDSNDFSHSHTTGASKSLKSSNTSCPKEEEKKSMKADQSSNNNHEVTLVEYLNSLLSSRGYSTQHFAALDGGYFCKPTDFQKVSYGMKLIQAVRTSNLSLVEKMLSKGISPNPCNAFGESILHTICRRGEYELLKIFLKYGSCVQVCDDFGRTPLHDACWTSKPCFEVVQLLLNQDRRLIHILDSRGASPLSYVRSEHKNEWIDFLERQKDEWWPNRVHETEEEGPPDLCQLSPHSCPQPNRMGISHDVASKIVNGSL